MAYPEPRYHRQETAKEYTRQDNLDKIDSIVTRQSDGLLGYISAGEFATTGSNIFEGGQIIDGNLTIIGDIYANTFNVTTTSIEHFTASTRFGLDGGDTHTFTGSVLITGSESLKGDLILSGNVYISGSTEFGGNLVPKTIRGATLGTSERPFSEIFISSGSINIASDIIGDPNTSISNIDGNLLVSAGGMRLVGNASFIAATGSFSYISGSMRQEGDYSQRGNYTMVGNKVVSGSVNITGSLNITGSARINNNNIVTVQKGTFNPQFNDTSGSVVGVTQSGNYSLMDDICFFRVNIDFANCTNFGTGQYQIQLPFRVNYKTTLRGGTLHQTSGSSGGTSYNITALSAETGSTTTALLYYTGTTSYLNWKYNTPVSASTTSSHFDINGTYQIS